MPASASPEQLFIRLYLDRHIKTQLAVDLRLRGYDVLTTQGQPGFSEKETPRWRKANQAIFLTLGYNQPLIYYGAKGAVSVSAVGLSIL